MHLFVRLKKLIIILKFINILKKCYLLLTLLDGNFKTHDNTARLQTVTGSSNAYLWKVLEKTRQYGYPILINTSLNAKGKPIVNTVDDFKREVQLHD